MTTDTPHRFRHDRDGYLLTPAGNRIDDSPTVLVAAGLLTLISFVGGLVYSLGAETRTGAWVALIGAITAVGFAIAHHVRTTRRATAEVTNAGYESVADYLDAYRRDAAAQKLGFLDAKECATALAYVTENRDRS